MESSKELALSELSYVIPQFMVTLARLQRMPKPDTALDIWDLRAELMDAREEFEKISSILNDYITAYQHELNQLLDDQYDPTVDRS